MGSFPGIHKPARGEDDRKANVLCVHLFFSGERVYSFCHIPRRVGDARLAPCCQLGTSEC